MITSIESPEPFDYEAEAALYRLAYRLRIQQTRDTLAAAIRVLPN